MHPYHQQPFIHFIVYFNQNQDYFECHEELEEYWKSIPGADKTHPLTAYILLATGMYHWRRGNERGALRTIRSCENRFRLIPDRYPDYLGEIDFPGLMRKIRTALDRIENGEPFIPFKIGVTSLALASLVEKAAERIALLPATSDAVIHKHMLRDRTDILLAREKKKRGGC